MRARSIVAAASVGAAAIVAGPFAQPASAGVTASSAGSTVTVAVTGTESINFDCVSNNLRVRASSGNYAPVPSITCASVTQVTVTGDGGDQRVNGSDLNGSAFSANPILIANLGAGGDFASETDRSDQINLGANDDWVDLRAGGLANGTIDLGAGASDFLAVSGTPDPNSMTAISANTSASVVTTYPSGSSTKTVSNAERIVLRGEGGDDTISTTGISAPSSIDNGSIEGGLGDDTITDGVINSYLYGGPGTNSLTGGDGQDSYWTQSNTDTINGSSDGNTEWIYDIDGLRSGGRTLSGFTAVDTYTVQAHEGDATMRIRPAAGGATLFTTSLTRTGQQLVPAALGKLTAGQGYSGSLVHKGLVDVVATNDQVHANLPNVGTGGLIDVTIPTGAFTAELIGTNLTVSSSFGTITAQNVTSADKFRAHGPWVNKNQGFPHRVYRDLLFRFLTNAQRDQLRDQLTNGTKTRAGIVDGIIDSDEYRGLDVDRVFLKYLDRVSDPGGRTYWINSIRNGKALWRFRAQLFGSNEYFTKAGGTNAGYVAAAYNDVLGRYPDPSGQTYWTNKLNNGADRGSVALQFINSPEARRRLVDDQFLRFLDRLPTTAEQKDLIAALVSGSTYYNRT